MGGNNGLEGSPTKNLVGRVRSGPSWPEARSVDRIRGIRKNICAHAAFDYLNDCNVAVMLCLSLLWECQQCFLDSCRRI